MRLNSAASFHTFLCVQISRDIVVLFTDKTIKECEWNLKSDTVWYTLGCQSRRNKVWRFPLKNLVFISHCFNGLVCFNAFRQIFPYNHRGTWRFLKMDISWRIASLVLKQNSFIWDGAKHWSLSKLIKSTRKAYFQRHQYPELWVAPEVVFAVQGEEKAQMVRYQRQQTFSHAF